MINGFQTVTTTRTEEIMRRMMLRLLMASLVICTAALPLQSGRLVPQGRVEKLPHRILDYNPMPRYQAGYVFSRNASVSSIWVDAVGAADGEPFDHAVALPDSFRVLLTDVAVSYDGSTAVVADPMDRDGRLVSVIAWLGPDGEPTRIVRTSPFAATGIGFTADGSLWAAGIEKVSRSEAHPSHDVVRQYDTEGRLVRSLLSRAAFPYDHWHPAYGSTLVTSTDYVALVSGESGTWTLISTTGVVVGHGRIGLGEGYRVISAAVTDSGRVFVAGLGPRDRHMTVFEIGEGSPIQIDTSGLLPPGHLGALVGSDGESLVFRRRTERGAEFIWASIE